MATQHEVDRLLRVYREYAAQGRPAGRWAADHPGNRVMATERLAALAALLGEAGLLPLGERRVLEVGCGTGEVLASLLALGAAPAALTGVDLRQDAVASARAAFPALRFEHGNGERLDFPDGAFDLVLAFTVFTSILDDGMARHVAREMARVLAPGGAVVWYDFRYHSPGNRHVRGIGARGVRRLFPGFEVTLRPLTLLPPLARRLGRATPFAYPLLARIPALRSHYLGLLRRAPARSTDSSRASAAPPSSRSADGPARSAAGSG